jgi:hypothetical protein
MKIICLLLTGLLLLSCPAGAAIIASTTPPKAQEETSIVPSIRATDLFTVPEVAEILQPGRFIQIGRLSVVSEFAIDRQVCMNLNKTDEIIAGAIIALN